jgi:hypothetical protein
MEPLLGRCFTHHDVKHVPLLNLVAIRQMVELELPEQVGPFHNKTRLFCQLPNGGGFGVFARFESFLQVPAFRLQDSEFGEISGADVPESRTVALSLLEAARESSSLRLGP